MDSTTLPVYKEKDTSTLSTSSIPTCNHNPSPTPHLSAQIANPQTQAHLRALTTALSNATQEGACLKCTGEAISQTLTAFLQDVRAAKKDGRWSHEEKRALRGEVKDLLKGMKHDVKGSWRKDEGAERRVRKGWYWKR